MGGKFKRRKPEKKLLQWIGKGLVITVLAGFALTVPFRWITPPTTAFILQHRIFKDTPVHRQWVPLDKISRSLPIAVVAAEDQKFPFHNGFDFEELSKALGENRKHRRGASTISQQLAKNLYLWPGRSLFRKALEAYLTVIIESTWPKYRILEVYLNMVEFGPGVYGADAASRLFFRKPPGGLTAREAAILAAVLPDPKRLSARHPSSYVLRRAGKIRASVRALGGNSYLPFL